MRCGCPVVSVSTLSKCRARQTQSVESGENTWKLLYRSLLRHKIDLGSQDAKIASQMRCDTAWQHLLLLFITAVQADHENKEVCRRLAVVRMRVMSDLGLYSVSVWGFCSLKRRSFSLFSRLQQQGAGFFVRGLSSCSDVQTDRRTDIVSDI